MVLGTLALMIAAATAPAPVPKAPTPEPTPKEPLRTIVRVKASTQFCTAFFKHFNGAVTPVLETDANIGYIDYTLGSVEGHYHELNREALLYNDRVNLIHYVGAMQPRVADAQAEVNALRKSAALATNIVDAADTLKIALYLQDIVNRQHQLTLDSQGVAQAMMEYALDENAQAQIRAHLAGGYDSDSTLPAAERDVRTYLHLQTQEDRIGDAEGGAAQVADDLAQRC